MADAQDGPPSRMSSEAKFAALKKEIAQRNDVAQRAGRAARAEREAQEVARRRRLERD